MLPFNAGRQFMDGWNEFSRALDEFGDWDEDDVIETDKGILEADLLYGDGTRNDSLIPALEELEDRGYRVDFLRENDINRKDGELYVRNSPARQLEGKPMIWRGVTKWKNMLEDIEDLRYEGVRTFPTPQGVLDCDNKKNTKRRLAERDISVTEEYDSLMEVEDALSRGNIVVEKPVGGSCGAGVEFIEPGDNFQYNPDNLYEEFVDHYDDPYTVERRAVTFTGDNVSQLVEVKNRESKESGDERKPKNISSGDGEYSDLDPVYKPLLNKEIDNVLGAVEAMGGGVLGMDYTVDLRTGETKVIEINSNVGVKGIREESNVDFYDTLADAIESEIEGEDIGRTYSDHLDDVIGDELSYRGDIENMLESAQIDSSDYSAASNKPATV